MNIARRVKEARRKEKAEAKRARRDASRKPACPRGRISEVMSTARSRTPSRAVRKRDERVRRVVRKVKKHAVWLDAPHFASLLCAYGVLSEIR